MSPGSASGSRAGSPSPGKPKSSKFSAKSGTSTPARSADPRMLDLAGLNLTQKEDPVVEEAPPKVNFAKEKLLEEAKRVLDAEGTDVKKAVSLVIIGECWKYHVKIADPNVGRQAMSTRENRP